MNLPRPIPTLGRSIVDWAVRIVGILLLSTLALLWTPLHAQSPSPVSPSESKPAAPASSLPDQAVIVEIEGQVEVSRAGSPLWDPARTNQPLLPGDRVRTGDRSRAVVQLTDSTVLRKGPQTLIEIPAVGGRGIRLLKGILYYFHRDKPRDFPVVTPACHAAIIGTEFSVAVAEDGSTTLHLIAGQVELTNEFGQIRLTTGESAGVAPGAAPARTSAITLVNAVQWCLYYPGILRLEDLGWPTTPPTEIAASLEAYRRGDLLRALAAYPAKRQPASDTERVYHAGILLTVGEVDRAEEQLVDLRKTPAGQEWLSGTKGDPRRFATVLSQVIATVRGERTVLDADRSTSRALVASELLADSYTLQAAIRLQDALSTARVAVGIAPDFAFGWVRVAELELSFGRVDAARSALGKGLALAPDNAEAHAMMGFLRAAENRLDDALLAFDRAIALDGALGNAWLGRGLCRIRRGDRDGGRRDLQVAVTVEPHRAILRSYLAKAYGDGFDAERAAHELTLARRLDAADPTAWFYSALLHQQGNRINQAVREMEQAQSLNDNRGVYRSRLLLDQDRAVRGANLATIQQDAGLTDVSVWEASRAVVGDYANPSAHLFLANSFDGLRDPRQVNVRYETPWLSEFLVANLLAPVGAGPLSPYVTRQEYSKLFERDRLGIVSSTEYLSRGDWIQTASQFGTWRNSSYAVDVSYRTEKGDRPNNDFRQLTTSVTLKEQLGPKDSLLFQAGYADAEAGDVNQYYNARQANLGLRIDETQEPFLLAGYHRAWEPGVHTLVLAGRIHDRLEVSNPRQESFYFRRLADGSLATALPFSVGQEYRSGLQLYTLEAQQIFQHELTTWILGGRFQGGEFDTVNVHENARIDVAEIPAGQRGFFEGLINNSAAAGPSHFNPTMQRFAAYSYLHWHPIDPLRIVAGVTFDDLKWPENHRYAPLTDHEQSTRRVSPKLGVIWTPTERMTLRGAYARALGGVSLDQSYQLEPTQVAGFVQSYRSLIPESVEGAIAEATYETWGLSLEKSLGGGTYLGLSGQILKSEARRPIGAYNQIPDFSVYSSQTTKDLMYEEHGLAFSVNQLVADEWSMGVRYSMSEARLEGRFSEIGPAVVRYGGIESHTVEEALLHQATVFVICNHPSGIFGQTQVRWNRQQSDVVPSDVRDEDFWQFDTWAGWRFFGRRVEITAGVLNLTDRNYRLHPLNLPPQPPRERTFLARLRFHF